MRQFSPKLPIWYQLAQMLRTQIVSGQLVPGERIGAEVKIAKEHGISVLPVRQALRALEEENLIVRRRGSGTYVTDAGQLPDRVATSLATLYSREFEKPAQILERGNIATPAKLQSRFPGAAQLAFVRRLAFRNNAPWSYGTLFFAAEFADRLTNPLLKRYPLYRLFHDLYSIELARSEFEAKAVAAEPEVAHFLGIEPFSPVLSLSSVAFDGDARAVGAFDMTFLSDTFAFSFETAHQSLETNPPPD